MALPATSIPLSDESERPPRLAAVARRGGPPPTRRERIVDNGVLGMAIFLTTEMMVFAGLVTAFLILRASAVRWPPPDQPRLPVEVTGLNTIVLLISAYTMYRASASGSDRGSGTERWLWATAGLGVAFLAVQGWEWASLLSYGLSASSSVFGGLFYTLIGCHAVHVLAAVLALLAVIFSVRRADGPAKRRATLQTFRLYWFFVVAIWPLLYYLVYLL